MTSIQTLEMYMAVVDTRSFTETAQRFGVLPSSVSRQMNSLEEKLGTKLLNRTTRNIQLTEAGQTLALRIPDILQSLDDTFATVQELATKPKGLIKIAAPVVFAELYFKELISGFRAQYPDITLELHLSEGFVDIVEQGFDIALRIGTLHDSNFKAIKLAANHRDVVVSPALKPTLGEISAPEDLSRMPCLTFRYESGREIWQFRKEKESIRVPVKGPIRVNNSKLLVQSAAAGQGIALCPRWLTDSWLKEGELDILFDDFQVTATEFDSNIYLVYPYSKQVTSKVRAFIDFCKVYFQQFDWAKM